MSHFVSHIVSEPVYVFFGAKAPLELAHVKKKKKKMERKILELYRFASVVSDDLQCC